MIQKLLLVLKEIFSNKFITLIVLLIIIVSIFTAGMFTVAGKNFNDYIHTRFGLSVPPNTIIIKEKKIINRAGIIKKIPITDRTMRKIKSIPGVSKIQPLIKLKIPVQARISSFLFASYRTDAVGFGAPYSFVYQDIPKRKDRLFWRRGESSDTVPVIVPTMFIDVYESFAEVTGFPQLPLDQLLNRISITLRFGHNSLISLDNVIEKKIKIVGFSKKINNFAIVLPYRTVKKYNKQAVAKGRNEYKKLFVEVVDHRALLSVTKSLKKISVIVDTDRGLSSEIVQLKTNVNVIINALKYLILGFVAIAIALSTLISVFNRLDYYRILRMLGCSKIFITISIFIKYACVGLVGSTAGLLVIEWLANDIARKVSIKGFTLDFNVGQSIIQEIILTGTMLPVIATIPALAVLYTRGLNRD